MSDYHRDRSRVEKALRSSGVVVVMNRDHVKKAEDLVTTMWEVYEAGLVAECTFRIDTALIEEAMQELTQRRAHAPAEKPFVLGVGSVINPKELEAAVEMGFDMVVAPANVMGGYGEGKEFVRITREANVFSAPAVLSPTELQYFIERDDGLEPDAVKIFPAGVHGPKGVGDLLAPYVRDRHNGRMIMPTGGVNAETGPQFQESITKRGYTPILGMSAPLALVGKRKKPGDVDTIRESLTDFRAKFKPYAPS
ncbi:MAG: bifunctional 4-hydroxy-2-oxoglutarate aldolase/2-dehydro-3-deoxy-phosphogluconate aldolase [Armatimonadota bacterium]|nr:MAG: bifunctional 4-hydroxy-2-oxoglutarate aldolase/2-dehydro-3-deoxy-phosphogluconate aldolase [Armatimonadota bacterium]